MGPRFCGHCGQEVAARRGPILGMVREILADWLSLDGRLMRTLALLVRPGLLTERYRAGQRVTYLRPFRLYLIASVLLFSSLLSLEAPDADKVNLYIGEHLVTESPPKPGRLNVSILEGDSMIGSWMIRGQEENIQALRQLPPQKMLNAIFAGLRRALPTAFILFVPFLALGLKVLYLRSGILYVDHLIFALHFQSVLFLALASTWLLCSLFGASLFASMLAYVVAGFLIILIYMPMSLHRVYKQSLKWTIVKSFLLFYIYGQLIKLIVGGAALLVLSSLT